MNGTLSGILSRYAERLIPLTHSADQRDASVLGLSPGTLFPDSKLPDAAWSGLLLLAGCWEESHNVSQNLPGAEGCYWHAIAHRVEPDSSDAGYWFRRVGNHPLFPVLLEESERILQSSECPWRLPASWDPALFISWCDEARQEPGSEKEAVAMRIQRAEWDLLFRVCVS